MGYKSEREREYFILEWHILEQMDRIVIQY